MRVLEGFDCELELPAPVLRLLATEIQKSQRITRLTLADGGASIQGENCCAVALADKDRRDMRMEQVS